MLGNKILKNKKGQEEMVGFALIMIIVAIIALVLLAVTSKKPVTADESRELANFLNGMSYYTTNCSSSGEMLSMKELIRACLREEKCDDGKYACEIMNKTLKPIVETSFPESGKVSGYSFSIEHNSTVVKNILTFGNLSCNGNMRGAELYYPANPGTITITMQGCY